MGSGARLLIVDGHPLLREGLTLAARTAIPGIAVDTADSLAAALAPVEQRYSYRLVIMAFDRPGSRGFASQPELKRAFHGAAIVLLSENPRAELVATARQMGVSGWLDTTWSIEQLVTALRTLLDGGHVFPPLDIPEDGHPSTNKVFGGLSDAQFRVLMALADGRSNKQIAFDLGIAEATVKAHLSASFRKLGVHNRAQALIAIQPIVAPE